MSFDADEEILQDFLVEAGELLELLSEQLVDLENRPDDIDLLNAIFRGFHTVKGGAGFLQLDALVEICHVAENVFDVLRNGKLTVSTELMDVVLQSLDCVNEMFALVNQRVEPEPADPSLLAALQALVDGAGESPIPVDEPVAAAPPPPPPPPEPVQEEPAPAAPSEAPSIDDDGLFLEPAAGASGGGQKASGDITDAEFEQFLDAIGEDDEKPGETAAAAPAPSDDGVDLFDEPASVEPVRASAGQESDEISEAEFEALLDQLHGKGQPIGAGTSAPEAEPAAPAAPTPPAAEPAAGSSESGDITDDEFEALLDELHGKGKHSGTPGAAETEAPAAATEAPAQPAAAPEAPSSSGSEDGMITDDEFENLLDELHGKGKGPAGGSDSSTPTAPPAASETPEPAAEPAAPAPTPAPAPAPAAKAPAPKKAEPKKAAAAAANKDVAAVATETTVRVDTKRLDDIMNMVGELVLVRNRLVRLGLKSADEAMAKAVANLDVVTADLQTSVMKTRMQPIKKVFGRFPRVVRDLARNLKKEINLELKGEETDLDKNLVEALADPLVHLVRNSVDHGVEKPEDRVNAGKPRSGKITLAAQQEGDHIVLSITDDGGGMDPEMLRGKAVEKGLMDEESAERLSDTECFNLIFHPGFSTKTEISDVSGRGVGMDVVKTKITQLNGTIEVQSVKGKGTVIAIKVPLTLAIMPTLMVMLGEQTFALPLVSVNEIFHMDLTKTNVVDGQEVVIVREKALPLFHLKRWLVDERTGKTNASSAHVVIVSVGTQKVGFVVDQLIGQEEVVIKPLGKMLHGTEGMAGATITGDGRIALILDVPSMLKRYAGRI